MKRISFIDLGSNSVRFTISEISDNGSYQLIYQQKESIRLSEGMSSKNKLTKEAIARAVRALKGFAHMAKAMNSTTVKAVATAAVRYAKNGQEFIDLVKKETGFTLECISGLEEARLGFLGVSNTIDLSDFVLFDLGGASIEVTLVRERKIVRSVSLPMGALTVTESFQKGTELKESEYEAMMIHIMSTLAREPWLQNVKLPLVGIGGTLRNLAKIDQRASEYPIQKLHNYKLKPERLEEIFKSVRNKNLAQRRKISGLSQERADIIIAGTAIIWQLYQYTQGTTLYVSGCGLREGLFYDYYGEHYLNQDGLVEDILKHSTENLLLSTPQNDLIHAKYVTNVANMLFDQWHSLHKLPPRMRQLLQTAALLHDSGKRINYYSHARHSLYVIVNANLYGLTHQEQALCGFMAAFSHGSNSKLLKSNLYAKLLSEEERDYLAKASLLLALAEALDESHEQSVCFLTTTIDENTIRLTAWHKEGYDKTLAEVALEKLQKQVKKEFKRDLEVLWEPAPTNPFLV